MTILVIGATGVVGRHLLSSLSGKGLCVRGMTRVEKQITQFPKDIQGWVADLAIPTSLGPVFSGVKKLFLTSPLHPQESELAQAAIDAAKKAHCEKIVYLSAQLSNNTDHIPHYRRKRCIEQALADSGITYTILRPNNFFQNDFWCRAAIMLYNVYPQPIGNKGIARIDARDVAQAAAEALCNRLCVAQEVVLNGPEILTGDSIAHQFSQALGRSICYQGDDLEAWAKQAQHMMPHWMVTDLKIMYRFFQDYGTESSDADAQRTFLPSGTRPFSDFVAEIVPQWQRH